MRHQLSIFEDFFIECSIHATAACHVSSEYDDVPQTMQGCIATGWTEIEAVDDEWCTHAGTCPPCSRVLENTVDAAAESL